MIMKMLLNITEEQSLLTEKSWTIKKIGLCLRRLGQK